MRAARATAAPTAYLLLAFAFSNFAFAQDESCAQLPLAQYQACMGLKEAAIIEQWPGYFRRSQPILSDHGATSGVAQTLTILPRSGNPIALLSYLPQSQAEDAPNIVDYRLVSVFPKIDLAYVTVSYYESVHHFYYRLGNGEQIVADGTPHLSPNGERLLMLACGESELGKIEPVFDMYEIQEGWLKRVYQLPEEIYTADWCPENVVWNSNNEIAFNYVQSLYTTNPNKLPNAPGLLRRLDQRWQLIRMPPDLKPM